MKINKLVLIIIVSYFIISCQNNIEKSFEQAKIYKKAGDYKKALNEYNYILKKDKSNSIALTNRGVLYFLLDKPELAMQDFNQSIKTDSTYLLAFYNRSKLRFSINDFQGAISDCEKLYFADNENIEFNLLCGKTYLDLKEYNKVLEHSHQILKRSPSNIEALKLESVAYFRKNNFESAIPSFKKILQKQEKNTDILNFFADSYVYLGKPDSAIRIFNILISLDSLEPTVYQKKGYCELDLEEYHQAEKCFTKSLSIEEHHTTYGLRGLAKKNQGRFDEAIADYKAGIKLNNKYPILFYNLAVCQSEINQPDSACFNFYKAAQLGMSEAEEMIKKYCD